MFESTSSHRWFAVALRLVLGQLLGAALLGSTSIAAEGLDSFTEKQLAEPIDFKTEVWPLLEQRCFACHGEKDAQGDLRLDDYNAIQRGGHTGSVILGTVQDSELLRRVISDEDGYRMPKGQTPLSRDEVLLLSQWIEQGAVWQPPNSIDQLQDATKTVDWNDVLDRLLAISEQIRFLGIPALLCALGILWIERRKRSLPDEALNESSTWSLHALGVSHYLVVALAFSLVATSKLYWASLSDLKESEIALTQAKRGYYELNARGSGGDVSGQYAVPQPFRPNHPPRLGGEYYRGNDERNPELFNGGYYRTATMNVSLRDAEGRVLQWNDPVPSGDLKIHLQIDRAPSATPSLFRDEAMKNCCLTRQIPGTDSVAMKDTPVQLEVVQPGEQWQADYVIAKIDQEELQADQPLDLKGLIYLGPSTSQAHYGIIYDLAIRDSLVDPKSEVWMGAIFTTGNVHVPKPKEIPLAQWFGFQPIPEIVGENSDDPDLLGITEHTDKLREQASANENTDAKALTGEGQ